MQLRLGSHLSNGEPDTREFRKKNEGQLMGLLKQRSFLVLECIVLKKQCAFEEGLLGNMNKDGSFEVPVVRISNPAPLEKAMAFNVFKTHMHVQPNRAVS